jgi:hypothetical protein
VGNPTLDPDAFDSYEASGWEEKAHAYERFSASSPIGWSGVCSPLPRLV